MKLLLVEADPYVSSWFKKVLDSAGFDVDVAAPGGDVAPTHYPVVMLGPHVGPSERASVMQSFQERAGAAMPLLWIAPPNGNGESGLSRDYLFDALQVEALAARFQALARLKRGDLGAVLRVGNLIVDSAQRQVMVGRKATFFPPAEVIVLAMLIQRDGKIVSKRLIETRLYGTTGEKANAAEVCIHRLRKRLAATEANVRIHTIRGLGYYVGA